MSDALSKFSESCHSKPVPFFAIVILCGVLGTSLLYSRDFSHYPGLQIGINPSVAAKAAGTTTAEAKVIHWRPALIQEMEWQPRRSFRPIPANTDPVKQDCCTSSTASFFASSSMIAARRAL